MAVDTHGGVLNHQVVQHHRTDVGTAYQDFADGHISRESLQIDCQSIAGTTQTGVLVHVQNDIGTEGQYVGITCVTRKIFAHIARTCHLQVADANAEEINVNVEVRNTHLGAQGESVGCGIDRKSTRLNSSHVRTSYAVFCLIKKT